MKSIYTYSAKQSRAAILIILAVFWTGFALGISTVLFF
jgi:hypothetical protein